VIHIINFMSNIIFYKYYFRDIDKPIIIEATDKMTSYEMLKELGRRSNTPIDMNKLIDMRLEKPIFGISKRKKKGLDYLWVGIDKTPSGWMLKTEFEEINKKNN